MKLFIFIFLLSSDFLFRPYPKPPFQRNLSFNADGMINLCSPRVPHYFYAKIPVGLLNRYPHSSSLGIQNMNGKFKPSTFNFKKYSDIMGEMHFKSILNEFCESELKGSGN